MIEHPARPVPVEAAAASSGHEHYALRGVDVFAVVMFWTFLALVSAAARELDPRIPGVPPRIMSAVLTATYVEYLLWAMLTLPIWWLSSRYNIEGGRRLGRVIMFVVLGVVIALTVDSLLLWLRERL